jgi:hypothetical protein
MSMNLEPARAAAGLVELAEQKTPERFYRRFRRSLAALPGPRPGGLASQLEMLFLQNGAFSSFLLTAFML